MKTNKKVNASIQVLPAHVQWKQESQRKYLSLTSSCPVKTRKSVQVFKSYQLMSSENKKVSASIQVLPAHVQWKQESQCKYSSLTSSCPVKTRKSVQVFKSYQLMSNENKKVSASI